MTANKRTEAEFQSLLRRLDLALEASHIGVWEHNLINNVVTWDQRMHKLYATEMIADVMPVDIWVNAIHPDDIEAASRDFEDAIQRQGSYQSEFRVVWPSGEIRHIRSKANYYLNGDGEPAFIGVEWDVTADVVLNRELARQQQIAEERAAALQASRAQIEHAAGHDYLTGLPNRRLFDIYCRALAERQDTQAIAVMHIDLDRFKQVNDEKGHEAGDLVLRAAAKAIAAAARTHDFVARMGGDEFVLVAADFGSEEVLKEMAIRIIATISDGVEFQSSRIAVGASIGIATSHGHDVEALLREADLALYSAKRSGRGQWQFHSGGLAETPELDQVLGSHLAEAIAREEIIAFYQVQRDAKTRAISGLEALARWPHATRGLLLPEVFLGHAREAGLGAALDQLMLKVVLRDIALWEAEGYLVPRVSLNLSPERLASPRLLADLAEIDIPAGRLCFEISASDRLHAPDTQTRINLRGIKERGIEIALAQLTDANASMLGLLQVMPDRLKLDHGLISPLTSRQEQLHMIHSIVELARAFNMKVTAEGVQSPDHADILKNLGCETLQGFGFGRPVARQAVQLELHAIKRDFKG